MNGSSLGGINGRRGNGTVMEASIPEGVRKMVQSLKEIVNLPDQEIYATLKECGMDPSETVQRLLSQDSFHQVKSKREKKKETKEPPDSRSQTTNITSNRGVRLISDHGQRTNFILSSSNGFVDTRGKAAPKKDDLAENIPSSKIGSSYFVNRRSTVTSENASTVNLWQATGTANEISLHSQPSSGNQHNWAGHFSMADIVKMGRPPGKPATTSTVTGNSLQATHHHFASDISDKYSINPVHSSVVDQGVHSSQNFHQPAGNMVNEPRTVTDDNFSDDDWSSVNLPNSGTALPIPETSASAAPYADSSMVSLVADEALVHETLHEDEVPNLEQSSNNESIPESQSMSVREAQVSFSEDKSDMDAASLQNMNAYLSQRHLFEQQEVDVNAEISSAAANLQILRLQKDDGLAAPTLEDNPAVIIPRHLQVTNVDCSHLSFGTFGSGIGTSSGSLHPKSLRRNSEVPKVTAGVPSLEHADARSSNYYDNDDLRTQITEDPVSSSGLNIMKYDISSEASEIEIIRDDGVNATREIQYNFPSLSSYGTSTSAPQNATTFTPQTNIQVQNHTSFSTLMQPYTNSFPSSLLAPCLQPLIDIDLPFPSLLANQSLSTKHSAITSISGPTVSIEPKQSVFSLLQQVPPSSSSSNLPAGHAIPQHLPINPYAQPPLPLAPFTNVISYPFLPQSYTYLPSAAFPQAYTTNGPFHQSSPAVHNAGLKYTLPQYKSGLSAASLPQHAGAASGYGNFSGSATVPGNFIMNPSATSTSTTLGFDEALSSQKDGTQYLHLQQNESTPMWIHGGSSRTVSPLPLNTFYGYQGHNQLNSFRQAQQPAHYGPMGYLNLYQNQIGGQSQEQQHSGEANPNGSQGNPSQPSHQIWQHGY